MDRKFKYKNYDKEGEQTLNVISEADQFNKWMFKSVSKYFKGDILEIGSGIGNISQIVLNEFDNVTLSDIRQNYCDRLNNKFEEESSLKEVLQLNLTDPDFDNKFKDYFGSFDTVFALNVIEHIENDSLAIENCYKLLKPQGRLIILVPAYQSLYNTFDIELEHYRRYTRKSMGKIVQACKFEVIKSTYFNFMGIFGWWLSGKIQKNKTIPKGQMGLYNRLVPIFKLVDYCVFKSMGLSTIVVAKKN